MVQIMQAQLSQNECTFYLKCNGKLLGVLSRETF